MKKLFTLCMMLCFLLALTSYSEAKEKENAALQKKKALIRDHMLFNSAQGREFWIAIPSNEDPTYSTDVLEIYVTSSKQTTVNLETGLGGSFAKQIQPMDITTFSSNDGTASFSWEVWESEKVLKMGIRIYADQPLSVYVLNAKPMTSEGFLALPTSALGTEYIHCSYYDHNEVRPWASGFIVVATMDNTKLRIELKGRGYAKTAGGNSLGDILTPRSMYAGEVYAVLGDATTRGSFDMTGTRIVSNKPVGLISFHQRTHIPSWDLVDGRDHLAEMIPPVHAWGQEYITVEYKRDSGQGDFFRVVAAENDTEFECTYYDLAGEQVIGRWNGYMREAGDFNEYLQITATYPNDLKSIRGISVFKANKPIMVMQYSYSADWDGNDIFDPFMILVVPVEQYIPSTVFQTPASKAFQDNWFNIIAVGDPDDPEKKKLKSIKVDDKPIYLIHSQFLYNRIPESNLFWAKIRMQPGAHKIIADTKFGGYIYGFSSFDSYGWPAAMAINKLDETDTLEPVLEIEGECGDYVVRATELRNGKEGDDPRQIDQGVSDIQLLDGSFNYILKLPDDFVPFPPVYDMQFELVVDSIWKSAKAIFAVTDRAGNVAIDSVFYYPDSLELDPDEVAFGDVRLNTPHTLTAELKNISESSITVTKIELKYGDFYTLLSGGAPPELVLGPEETHNIEVEYLPKEESLAPDDLDIDSILVETECLIFNWPVTGRGIIPKIRVEDFHAGAVQVNTTKCKDYGLRIRNIGSAPMDVYGIDEVDDPPFSVDLQVTSIFPFTISPGGEKYLEDVCFTPLTTGFFSDDNIVIRSNAGEGDSISLWDGEGILPGPKITDYTWVWKRRLTDNDGVIEITNTGNQSIWVEDLQWEGILPPDFLMLVDQASPNPPPIEIHPEDDPDANKTKKLTIPVKYIPQTEGDHEANIKIIFRDQDLTDTYPGRGNLRGDAWEPVINPSGYNFQDIVINTLSDEIGNVTIKSAGEIQDTLNVYDVYFDPAVANPHFEWDDPDNATRQDFIVIKGQPVEIPVRFFPKVEGNHSIPVIIEHDGGPGPQLEPVYYDTVLVTGRAYYDAARVDTLDFGLVSSCDEPVETFPIENMSRNSALLINKYWWENGASGEFSILNIPDRIEPEETLNGTVLFRPTKAKAGIQQVHKIALEYEFEGSQTPVDTMYAVIIGTPDVYEITVSLNSMNHAMPGLLTTTPQEGDNPFCIRIDASPGELKDAYIRKFEIRLKYHSQWLDWIKGDNDRVRLGDALDPLKWDVRAVEEYDIAGHWKTLHITGKATDANAYISQSGILCVPELQILLSDTSTTEFSPTVEASFLERDSCINITAHDGKITVNTCVIDIRPIIVEGQYALAEVAPNPVIGSEFDLNYSVAIEAPTRIELYNTNKELIRSIINATRRPGKYTNHVSTEGLASGVYFIVMRSGPFSEMRRLVIVK